MEPERLLGANFTSVECLGRLVQRYIYSHFPHYHPDPLFVLRGVVNTRPFTVPDERKEKYKKRKRMKQSTIDSLGAIGAQAFTTHYIGHSPATWRRRWGRAIVGDGKLNNPDAKSRKVCPNETG